MRILFASAALCCMLPLECAAGPAAARVTLVARHAKQCDLHLALPANWTIKQRRDQDACVVTAEEPEHASRCGTANGDGDGDRVLCEPDLRITVAIRQGSIDDAARWSPSDLYPFHLDDGKWRLTNAHLSEREAIPLHIGGRKALYADYATRELYQDGSYCCAGRNWWAMVDLRGHRIASVELSWDFIAWDVYPGGWSDATDAQAASNFERFLQSLR